jgi:glycosyltransferase involved in cell wall biosynthesis
MRILLNVKSLAPTGGIETFVLNTTRELARRGHEIDLVYVHGGALAGEYGSFCRSVTKVPSFDISPRRTNRKFLRPAEWAADLCRITWAAAVAARRQPDVIYAQGMFSMIFGVIAGGLSRRPVVCQMHGVSGRPGTHLLGQRVEQFIAVSDFVRERGVAAGLEAAWITTVHLGIDLTRFVPGDLAARTQARATLDLERGAFVVLYAGRLEHEKGIDILLEAWRSLGMSPSEACLLVVGSPLLQADPDAYLRELKTLAPPGCRWLPMQPDITVPLHAADVVVVPSRCPEAFGLVTIEAMATGRPVVASRIGGIPEVLTGQFERFLFDPGDSTMLADRLCGLSDWRVREPELAAACTAHVQERFGMQRMIDELERILKDSSRDR